MVRAEETGRERLGGGGVESVERDHVLDPTIALRERRPDVPEFRAGQAEQQEGHVLDPLGQVLQEVEEQWLGPLDVVDHDDHRTVASARAHQPPYAPERLLDRTGRRRADQPREDVDKPFAVGFVVGQQRAEPLTGRRGVGVVAEIGGITDQLRDRRERGVAGAVAAQLDGDRPALGRGGGAQLARESGLADARRSEDGDQPRGTSRYRGTEH